MSRNNLVGYGLPVSQLDVVDYKGTILIPAVDITLPVGSQNVAYESSTFVSTMSAGSTPASGSTIQIEDGITKYFVRGTSTLNSLTINLPLNPIDNQELILVLEINVTELSVTAPSNYSLLIPITNQAYAMGSKINLILDSTIWI